MKPLKFKTRWLPALMNLIGLGIAFSIFLILLSQVWWDYRYDRSKGGRTCMFSKSPHLSLPASIILRSSGLLFR